MVNLHAPAEDLAGDRGADRPCKAAQRGCCAVDLGQKFPIGSCVSDAVTELATDTSKVETYIQDI
jgi:hypothetical protein